MEKKTYMKPQMEVVKLVEIHHMLAGSPNPPEWSGEGGAPALDDFDLDD